MVLNELVLLLKTADCAEKINERRDEIGKLIPAVKIMFDYDQQNHAHQFDLWMHSLNAVVNLPRDMEDDMLYLAALFHDIGKPESRCGSNRPDDVNMHYYGHPNKSMEIVDSVIIPDLDRKGYEISCMDVKRLLYYVEYHDDHVNKKLKHLNRHLKMVTYEEFKNLMLLQVADAKAHVQLPIIAERVEICSALAGEEGEVFYQIHLEQVKREEHLEECGFDRIHEKVIAWAELPKPFIPNAKE